MLLLVATLTMVANGDAERALSELQQMCAADAGRTWGRSLCGPVVIVDPKSRRAVTARNGENGSTTVPEHIAIANTAVDWDGVRWTMVMWPLPEDPIARRVLLAHESFHTIQKDLGFTSTERPNAHLDSAEGRYWLRLEWRALARAIASEGSEAETAVRDALIFRSRRRQLSEAATADERALEMNEGLAEHTGLALAIPPVAERSAYVIGRLASAERNDSFVRSFAYASGAGWGTLIDRRDPAWTRKLRPEDDLGSVAQRAWQIGAADGRRADERAAAYGGNAVRESEEMRAMKKDEEKRALRTRFIDDPVLTLPLRSMQMVFDPNMLVPLDDAGTVYRSITISDVWGKIVVTDGALLTGDFSRLVVPASGVGYTLSLAEEWTVVDDQRLGDRKVVQTGVAED